MLMMEYQPVQSAKKSDGRILFRLGLFIGAGKPEVPGRQIQEPTDLLQLAGCCALIAFKKLAELVLPFYFLAQSLVQGGHRALQAYHPEREGCSAKKCGDYDENHGAGNQKPVNPRQWSK